MSFSDRLVEAFGGASMAEIARRLELPHSTIRNYVQHNRLPSAEVLVTIANRTNVSLHWLLTGEGEKSARSSKLGDLHGWLNERDIAALEKLRAEWQERREVPTSWDDFILTLIQWGESGIRQRNFREDFEKRFESLEYVSNRESILARSIVEIVRYEMQADGELANEVRKIVRDELDPPEGGEVGPMQPAPPPMVARRMGKVDGGEDQEERRTRKKAG